VECDEILRAELVALDVSKRIQAPEKGPSVDVVKRLSVVLDRSEASKPRHQLDIGRNHLDRLVADRPEIPRERRARPVDALGHPHPVARHVPRLGAACYEQRLDRLGFPDAVVEVGNADRRVGRDAEAQVELVVARLGQADRVGPGQIAWDNGKVGYAASRISTSAGMCQAALSRRI